MPALQHKFASYFATVFLWVLGLSLVAAILFHSKINFADVKHIITHVNYLALLGMIVCTGMNLALTASKWKAIIEDITGPRNIAWGFYFYYATFGAASALILPQSVGNIGVRALALKLSHKFPLRLGLYSVVLDQLFDLLIMSLLLLPAILFFLHILSLWQAIILMAVFLSASLFFLIKTPHKNHHVLVALLQFSVNLASRIPFFSKKIGPQHIAAIEDFQIRNATALKLYRLSLLRYLILTTRAYFLIIALKIGISFAALLLCIPIVQLSFLFAVTPGSLGITEAGWYAVLLWSGATKSGAILFVGIQRIVFVVSVLAMQLIGFIFYRIGMRRHSFRTQFV